jgi:hypothetical protein
MSDKQSSLAAHEPSLHTIEMVCDRLGEMGLAVGPDTARDLVRAVLAAEAPRVDARLREVLDTALETIRVAAQAAMGVLATTSPATAPPPRREKRHSAPQQAPHQAAHQAPPPRPDPKRARDDFDDEDRRPVFRRPRGR